MSGEGHVIIAALDWGLGHATRCVPLIRQYLDKGKRITLASDGASLAFWKKEFPELKAIELPSYDIRYSLGGAMAIRILAQIPKLNKKFKAERKVIDSFLENDPAELLISDSRFGLGTEKCKTAFMTHQVFIQSPFFPQLVNRKNHRHISDFDEVWVPDHEGESNLSGKLGHGQAPFPLKYIGPLSRFRPMRVAEDIDVVAVLSGPEPQRGILEKLLAPILTGRKAVIVRGVMSDKTEREENGLRIIGHLMSEPLNVLMARAKTIICRSGYSSIMDLEVLSKNAILIPTPGQTEQEYLATHLTKRSTYRALSQSDVSEQLPQMLGQ